jgi:hypothetical protein
VGLNRWSAGSRPGTVLVESARAEAEEETLQNSLERIKALKREAQERWELKKTLKRPRG